MKRYLLGMDRGSTNVKAALYDCGGREIAAAALPLEPPRKRHPGWAEQDMDLVWVQSAAAVRRLLDLCGVDPKDIAAVGFSGHGGGLYAVDGAGRPARLGIMSMDNRMYEENQRRRRQGEPVIETSKVDAAALLAWVKRHEPDVYGRIRYVMAAKDWVRYCMTGEAAVSGSDFGMSAFVDNGTKQYDPQTCARFGIPEAQWMLPPCRQAWEVCGSVTEEAARETGLAAGTPCVMGGHDCALASFGVGGIRTGHLTVILGTFAMNVLVGERDFFRRLPPDAYGMYDMSVLPDQWLYLNSTTSGSGLDWFVENFCQYEVLLAQERGISVQTLLEDLAEQASPTSKVAYHPFIIPVWDNPRNGHVGLYGADLHTTRSDIVRAVFDGLAFAEVRALEGLKAITEVKSLTLTGGGAKNRFWGQMFADLLDIPVEIPKLREAACRGAALLAGIGVGLLPDHQAAASLPMELARRFEPSAATAALTREKYGRFCQLIEWNKVYWNSL